MIPHLLTICGVLSPICGVVHGVAASAFQSVVDAMSASAGELLRTVLSFWTRVDLPDLGAPTGVTFWVDAHLGWLVSAAAVFSVLVGAGRLAVSRRAEHGYDVVRMLVRTMVTAAVAVPVVSLLAAAGDAFAKFTLKGADVNSLATLKLAALTPGTVLIGDLIIALTSLFQMGIMITRGAVVAILVGLLPVTAATTNTATGKASFAKLCGWLGSFLAIKPLAAVVYAIGLQLEAQTSAQAELSGVFVLGLAVFALPVLMKILVPAAGMVGSAGGGALTLAAAGAAATGAVALTGGGAARGAARAGGTTTGSAARSTGTGGTPGGGTAGNTPGGGGGGLSPSGSGSGGSSSSSGGGAGGDLAGSGLGGSTGSGAGSGGSGASGVAEAAVGGGGTPAGSAAPAGDSPGAAAAAPPTAGTPSAGAPSTGSTPPPPAAASARSSNPWVMSARQVADNARAAAAAHEPEPGLNISDSRGEGR